MREFGRGQEGPLAEDMSSLQKRTRMILLSRQEVIQIKDLTLGTTFDFVSHLNGINQLIVSLGREVI